MVQNPTIELIVLGIIAFVFFLFALYKRYFSLPPIDIKKEKYPSFISVFTLFLLFFCFGFLLPSLFISIMAKLIQNGIIMISPFKETFFITTFHLIASLSSLVVILYYGLHFKRDTFFHIWKDRTIATTVPQDAFFGIAFCLTIFPIILFLIQVLGLLTKKFFNISELPPQNVVLIVKESLDFPILFFFLVITISIIPPIVEEFLFRGFLQNWLKRYMGRGAAILLASFIFGAYHFSTSQSFSNIPIIFSLFLMGCFLGILYEKRRSLISPILCHGLFNLISIIIMFFTKG